MTPISQMLEKTGLAIVLFFITAVFSSEGISDSKALGITPDSKSLEILIETIENDAQRARFLENLVTLKRQIEARKERNLSGNRALENKENTSKVFSNQRFFGNAQNQTDKLLNALTTLSESVGAVTHFPNWFVAQYTEAENRAFWFELTLLGVVLPMLVALIAHGFVRTLCAKTIRRLRDADLQTLQGRLFAGGIRVLLDAVSVGVVLAAGYIVLGMVPRSSHSFDIAELLIYAIALITGIGVLARGLLSPHADLLRVVPIAAVTSAYLYVWVRRLSIFGVVGYTLSKVFAFTTNPDIILIVEVLSATVFASLLVIMILQSRDQLARAIRGDGHNQMRNRLGDIWHVLALIYIFLVFCIFGSGAQNGFVFLIKSTAITVVAAFIAVLLSLGTKRLIDRIFRIDPELNKRFPGLLQRSSLYRPVLRKIVDGIILVAVCLTILAGWEVDLFSSISAELRGQIIKSAGTILLVIVLCVVGWEFASGYIAKILAKSEAQSSEGRVGSRSRTLLPLLRRAILVALVVFGSLIVLAEVGVDIGPLMAGAGVIGLAIGFGSQALVRDIITGLFILIEDTIAVGDVVTVGGHTGLVEDLSIRTIRLRDVAGTVHTVPFGDVTTVENLTKDFSYALLDIGIAYREDTDAVSRILEEVCAGLQSDDGWGKRILEPIHVMGVQELADSAVVIRSRIKTEPIMQWAVKREFLRRVKKRFDEEGIELPFPHTTLYFGEDKAGEAPAARVLIGDSLKK